jgi:RNA recognition motif-containing protein
VLNAELMEKVDKLTIYIENLPSCITQSLLSEVFSSVGSIKHISLPSFHNSKQNKGFGFIVFQDENAVQQAIEKFNNSIPSEFFNLNLKKQQALVIYSKIHWLECKIVLSSQKIIQANQKGNQPVF